MRSNPAYRHFFPTRKYFTLIFISGLSTVVSSIHSPYKASYNNLVTFLRLLFKIAFLRDLERRGYRVLILI